MKNTFIKTIKAISLVAAFLTVRISTQAQSNYFKSLYDAIIAKVSYLKALGKL